MIKNNLKFIPLIAIFVWAVWGLSNRVQPESLTTSQLPTATPTQENYGYEEPTDNPVLGSKKYTAAPTPFLNQNKTNQVKIDTNLGSITIELFTKEVPVAANNFAFLAKEGFYNNVIFHRVIKDFMIQGGDPLGNGTGDAGYKFNDEPITRKYTRGTVAYANSGKNTNGSQFFIMHKDYDLQPNYVIFGQVVSGMDVVDKIATSPVEESQFGELSKPTQEIIIQSARLIEK